jgi:hypothetical protein
VQQVLAAAHDLDRAATAELGSRDLGPSQFGLDDRLARERGMEALRGTPDGVALGHGR